MRNTPLRTLALLLLLPLSVNAVPIIGARYVNNGQAFDTSESVSILVEVTNSGDIDASDIPGRGVAFGNWNSLVGGPYDASPSPSIPGVYAAGTSTIIELFRFTSSAAVPAGSYFTEFSELRFSIAGVPRIRLGRFDWTVSDAALVSEPGPLVLLALGLIGLSIGSRKRAG